jgi:hypothetical protein
MSYIKIQNKRTERKQSDNRKKSYTRDEFEINFSILKIYKVCCMSLILNIIKKISLSYFFVIFYYNITMTNIKKICKFFSIKNKKKCCFGFCKNKIVDIDNEIVNNITGQIQGNIYILKKDILLYKLKIENKKYFVVSTLDNVLGYETIKINKNTLIKIISPLISEENINKKIYKINLQANIIDLHIDYCNREDSQELFYNLINDKITSIPIIVNNLFNYRCELQQLFNYKVPNKLDKQIHENFIISFDNNFTETNEITYNSDYLLKINLNDK